MTVIVQRYRYSVYARVVAAAAYRPPQLADLHLTTMIAAFSTAPEGAALLRGFADLSRWWDWMAALPCMTETDTGLPGLGPTGGTG